MKKYLLLILLIPVIIFGQNTVTPNSANDGDYLEVFISGTSKDFYSDWSSCYTQLRFIHHTDYSTTINLGTVNYNSNSGGVFEWIWIYGWPTGTYDLQSKGCQTNHVWQTLAYNAFEVIPPPSILTVSPDEVLVNSGPFSITIVGENTQWLGQNIQNIRIINNGSYYANNSSIISNNLIIADFSSIPNSGEYELQLQQYDSTTNNWTWLNYDGFTVLPDPQLNSISPNIGLQGQQLSVSISGSGAQFMNEYSGTATAQFRLTSQGNSFYGSPSLGSGSGSGYNNLNGTLQVPSWAST